MGAVRKQLYPDAGKMMGIPDDHCMPLIVGFGYPEIRYARGVQRNRKRFIHRGGKNK